MNWGGWVWEHVGKQPMLGAKSVGFGFSLSFTDRMKTNVIKKS